jgi:5-methylcytosine-specific restriction protein A
MKLCKCGAIVKGKCDRCYPSNPYGSASKRGYDRQWRRVRESYLAEQPLCEDCLKAGRTTGATEVHHKRTIAEAPHIRLDRNNLRALCTECHHNVHNQAATARR